MIKRQLDMGKLLVHIHRGLTFIKNVCRELEWRWYKKRRRRRLTNTDFSIIAVNCCGTIMYHDLGLPFSSPTINLVIGMEDLVKMMRNLRWYMEQEIVELESDDNFPVGLLGDIRINFVHYDTFEDAVLKWEERKKRINWDNIFIVGTDGYSYKAMEQFDQLPYENKVILTRTNYPEIASAYWMKEFGENSEGNTLLSFKNQFLKRRYIDDFDYVRFLNGRNNASSENSNRIAGISRLRETNK